MAWTGVITNIGKDMLSQWVAGAALNVTGAAAGSGTVAEAALVNQTALVSQKQEMGIVAGAVVPQGRRIKLQINAPETGYTLNQIGVWASVGEASPVLMALYQIEDGIVVPSQTEEEAFTFTFYAVIATDNTGELNLTIDSEALVTQETMEDYVAEAIADKADLVGGKVPVAQIPDLEYAPKYNASTAYPASSYCVHRGALWVNTSGGTVTGVEPGTDYNKWNVTYSNENLLDNPWFTVNQRGQSEYTGAGYTADRWAKGTAGKANVTDGGLIITETQVLQIPENVKRFAGKQVAISIRAMEGSAFIVANVNGTWLPEVTSMGGVASTTYALPESITSMYFVVSTVGYETSAPGEGRAVVGAVKLEFGHFSTLANDGPPDYGTELAKCQRYFQRIKPLLEYGLFGIADWHSKQDYDAYIPYTPMRSAPTISVQGSFVINKPGSSDAAYISNIRGVYASGTYVRLRATADTAILSAGQIGVLIAAQDINARIDLSADL